LNGIFTTTGADLDIKKLASPVTIDGVKENIWNQANGVSLENTLLGSISGSSDAGGTAYTFWDNDKFYLFLEVSDDQLEAGPDAAAYQDDGIEIYFDINNDKSSTYGADDYQYRFRINDIVSEKNGHTTGVDFVQNNTATGYDFEIAIPWSTLGGSTPSIGDLLGFDVHLIDDDDGGDREAKLAWYATVDDSWKDPSVFGTAKLKAELVTEHTELNAENNIRVYPSVTDGIVFINGTEQTVVSVISVPSGVVKQINLSNGFVDISGLPVAMYMLKINNQYFKIIKTK
jgi:hypothetical protein